MKSITELIMAFPAMRGMRVDELTQVIELLEQAIDTAKAERIRSCEGSGHNWDHPEGKMVVVSAAHEETVCAGISSCGERSYRTEYYPAEYGLRRTCLSCGKVEIGKQRSEVIQKRDWTEWQ